MRHHNLQVTGSVSVNGISAATAADLAVYTGSNDTKVSTLQSFTASISTTNTFTASASSRLNSIETISASNIARINAIEIVTSSTSARLNSIETISASNISRISSLETISASNIARISSLETTSASVDTLNTTQNSRLTNLEIKTGSLATTGSNTFIGTQTITGSLYISSDLIVQGSSSLQNITASAVSIGTNIINLNTANPAIRYAGLVIGDSGSIGSSGSFFYDSVQDEMIFVHRGANSTVTSSVVLMGPQTYDSIGSESYLTSNRITKGTGNEHLVDSNISDTGTLVTINSVTSSFTGVVGMGTTTPMRKLDIVATGEQLRLSYDGSTTYTDFRNDSAGGLLVNTSAGYIVHYIAGSPIMRMNANGNVGIGLTNPSEKLQVSGSISSVKGATDGGQIQLSNSGGGSLWYWAARTTGLNLGELSAADGRIFIKNGGNVGIGTIDPGYLLHVNGNVYATRYIGAITESGSGDGNAPFKFSADYSGWMSHVAGTPGSNDGWGIFWAGNTGAQYGTNQAGAAGNIWSNSTNPNEIVFVGGGNTMMSVHSNTGNVWIKGETRIASQLRVNGGSSTTPAAVFTSGGASWSEGIWVNPSPNNYAGVYFLTAADTPGDGMWFTGKVSNTISGWEHAYGIFRRGYTSPIGGGTATFAIKQDGTAYFNENVINTKANKALTFVQLNSTNFATKTFTYTGNSVSSFAVTDFSGIPSNAKAVQVVGWYHITGYSAGLGQGDHAMSWFGPATINNTTQWGDASAGWPASGASYTPRFHGTFVMEHDGDASIQSGNSGAMHYYGSWHQGTINVHTDGNIYYSIGAGISGGTHYNALVATGYWI